MVGVMKKLEHIPFCKPDEVSKPASKPAAGRRDEALRILEEYADDLRQIIAKLRSGLH